MLTNQQLKERLTVLARSQRFHYLIIFLILFNAVILGLETYPAVMARVGFILNLLDDIVLSIFVCELILYMYIYGIRNCLSDPWYLFDAFIIFASFASAESLSSLRALRVLRVLRLITKFHNLRRVVTGMIAALPGIGSIITLLFILMYVGALISTNLFGKDFPSDFGTLQSSLLTLFQIMLNDDTGNVIRTIMASHPYSWAFFIGFIFVSTFIILNLFVAVIVDGIQNSDQHQKDEHDMKQNFESIKKTLAKIEKKLN